MGLGGVTLLMLMPIHVQDERGIALLLTLMATVLLTALGGALITLTTAETAIASNYRNAVEAFYALSRLRLRRPRFLTRSRAVPCRS